MSNVVLLPSMTADQIAQVLAEHDLVARISSAVRPDGSVVPLIDTVPRTQAEADVPLFLRRQASV
jgi:hypothetical protein